MYQENYVKRKKVEKKKNKIKKYVDSVAGMTMCGFETGCPFRTPSSLFKIILISVSLKKLNKIRRDAYANFPFLPYSAFLTFFF